MQGIARPRLGSLWPETSMSSSNESRQDSNGQDPQPQASGEQEHAGNSGEGAASALAHLKTQTRQHRRQSGHHEDPGGGHGQ
jgi:hypothetical protein